MIRIRVRSLPIEVKVQAAVGSDFLFSDISNYNKHYVNALDFVTHLKERVLQRKRKWDQGKGQKRPIGYFIKGCLRRGSVTSDVRIDGTEIIYINHHALLQIELAMNRYGARQAQFGL